MAEIMLALLLSSTCFEQQSVEFFTFYLFTLCKISRGSFEREKEKKRDPRVRIFKILH